MNFFILLQLFYLIYSQNTNNTNNTNNTFIKHYSYSYLCTQFLPAYSSNIVAFKGKTNITKCFAGNDIKINDIIFEYEKKDIISNINMILPNEEKIASIIKKYVNDTYLQNKFLLSFFIYHVMTNPYNVFELDKKLRLFILYLPIEEISNPIVLFVDKNKFGENLINKEWIEYPNDYEVDLINNIIKDVLEIDVNNKTDENYILFGKIFYFVKTNSFNINGNAVIIPFMDSCNIIPYYVNRDNKKYDSIFFEENENKIIVKSKININQSDQFIFSFDIPLTNEYLLLNKGKVIFNNINDRYLIKKNFFFENNTELGSFLLKMHLTKEELLNIKLQRKSNNRFGQFNFELAPNKICEYFDKFGDVYYNNNMMKKYILLIRMCYDEFKNIFNIIKEKFNSKNFEDYLLQIQNEEEISELNNAIMNYNLAKIKILENNVNLAFEKLIQLNINKINKLKENYL